MKNEKWRNEKWRNEKWKMKKLKKIIIEICVCVDAYYRKQSEPMPSPESLCM